MSESRQAWPETNHSANKMPDSTIITPCFAVVGHPNKGKSSIVATLAQDDSVYVDLVSGSTKKCATYPMSIDGTVLYKLIDTPGFQRARAVKEWLEAHCNDASQRSDTIKHFCATHREDRRFQNECELLQPLTKGAGIIYVVDGSRPYGTEYEAEMEILRWTGCPSMALINPIHNEDYVAEWEKALSQFFRTVRVFNAHEAEFNKQIELLNVFGSLVAEWHSALALAVESLLNARQKQHLLAAETIADLVIDCIQHSESQRIPDGLPVGYVPGGSGIKNSETKEPIGGLLANRYKQALASRERAARRSVEQLFAHYRLQKNEPGLVLDDGELFDQSRWYLFGLSKKQLITGAAGAGASAGAIIDLGLGGSSLFLGGLTGGILAGVGAWHFSEEIAKLKFKGIPSGGRLLQYGPSTHPNFPFVILGRALHHYISISTRSHAMRSTLDLPTTNPYDSVLNKDRIKLSQLFKAIQKNKTLALQRKRLSEFIFQRFSTK